MFLPYAFCELMSSYHPVSASWKPSFVSKSSFSFATVSLLTSRKSSQLVSVPMLTAAMEQKAEDARTALLMYLVMFMIFNVLMVHG